MVDSNFFIKKNQFITVKDLLTLVSANIDENLHIPKDCKIFNISKLSEAKSEDLSFFDNPKYINQLINTNAGACLVTQDKIHLCPKSTIPIIVKDVYVALSKIATYMYEVDLNIQTNNYISPNSNVHESVKIGYGSIIHDGVVIEEGVKIHSNVVIHKNCKIGKNTTIYDNVVIQCTYIGENCIIKPGAKIGQEGFGFAHDKIENKIIKMPQLGVVKIYNNVEVGANATVDRGSFGDTKIYDYVKLDNLVQIGHNVEIKNYTMIAAQSGISGSSLIGLGCLIGGQTGIAGHIEIGDFCNIAAKSGLNKGFPSKSTIGGHPARNLLDWQKSQSILHKLVKDRSK